MICETSRHRPSCLDRRPRPRRTVAIHDREPATYKSASSNPLKSSVVVPVRGNIHKSTVVCLCSLWYGIAEAEAPACISLASVFGPRSAVVASLVELFIEKSSQVTVTVMLQYNERKPSSYARAARSCRVHRDVPTSVRVTDERRGADVSAERVRVVCMVVCSVLVVV